MSDVRDRVFILNSVDSNATSRSHDFTIDFIPPQELDAAQHYVGVDKISMSYSWYNISEEYDNNVVKYSHDSGKTWTTITFSDGNYSYRDIQSIIESNLTNNGHSESGIEIRFTQALTKVLVSLESGYHLDMRSGDFSTLLGFHKRILSASAYSDKLPDITRGVDSILVHCNLTSDSIVSGLATDIVFDFSLEGLALSHPFSIEPRRPSFNVVNTRRINRVRVYITDALLRPVDLNGIPLSIKLIIRHHYD